MANATQTPVRTKAPVLRPDGPAHCFTAFCKAVAAAGHERPDVAASGRRLLRENFGIERQDVSKATPVTKAVMNEGSGSAGGYITPVGFTLKLLEPMAEDTFFYPRANIIPMNSGVTYAPRLDVETVPAATGVSPMFAGV